MSTAATTTMQEFSDHDVSRTALDESRTRTPHNVTRVSIESSTNSCEFSTMSDNFYQLNSTTNQDRDQDSIGPLNTENINTSSKSGFNSYWPHKSSRTLALISCTLGLFNLSRFAILTINYGVIFCIQFCILSTLFGIPFLWLQMSLGAKIEAGPTSMWKISPICIGIGISITCVQCLTTIYSSVAVVRILKYFEDILINKSSYPWAEFIHPKVNRQFLYNTTPTIPDYLNANILQGLQISKISDENEKHLKIDNLQLAFYLVLIWAAVFLILCKGLKSLGEFVLLFGVLPILFLAIIAVKLLCVVDFMKLQNAFTFAQFDDFLVNSKAWAAAAQEAFLTWGFFGASVIAVSSRTHKKCSKSDLRKDAILVVLVTLIGLCLSALIGLCSVQIINKFGYIYVPGSYEISKHSAVHSSNSLTTTDIISYPTKYVPHYSTLIGEVYRNQLDTKNISGYQLIRFITELLPAVVVTSAGELSWIWTSMIFIVFFLFGFTQLCVMWKPISCALGNSSSAVLLTCASGLLLSLPFITETGITLLHFMDMLLGGAWFVPVLWCAEIFGVFLIRGRPYNGDDLVNDLRMSSSVSAFLALSWNILLPIGLITLAAVEYKISLSNQFYSRSSNSYFNYWPRKVGALTQIGFLIFVPIAAIVQMCRYLTSGPPDILHRIQMLHRPLNEVGDNRTCYRINRNIYPAYTENNRNSVIGRMEDVDPPKYTPPPSYTAATGAKLTKILRKSFSRRYSKRFLGASERSRPIPSISHATQSEQAETNIRNNSSSEFENIHLSLFYGRGLSMDRKYMLNKYRLKGLTEFPLQSHPTHIRNLNRRLSCKLYNRLNTTEDVMPILSSSAFGRTGVSLHVHTEPRHRSVENLVQTTEQPNLSPAVIDGNCNPHELYFTSVI